MNDTEDMRMGKGWTNKQTEYTLQYVVKCLCKANLHQQSIEYYERKKVFLTRLLTILELLMLFSLVMAPSMAVLLFAARLITIFFMNSDDPKQHKWSKEKFFNLAVVIMSELSSADSNYKVFMQKIFHYYDCYSEEAPDIPNPVVKEFINKKNEL